VLGLTIVSYGRAETTVGWKVKIAGDSEVWGWTWFERLSQDLLYGFRMLGKNPAFTAIGVVALALGIGANTAIFSFADLIVRRPVHLPGLDRMAVVYEQVANTEEQGISVANHLDFQSESPCFQALAAYRYRGAGLDDFTGPDEARGVQVIANFFPIAGAAGLLLTERC
jgi:hypothetical protein